jgi:hypothetical protein
VASALNVVAWHHPVEEGLMKRVAKAAIYEEPENWCAEVYLAEFPQEMVAVFARQRGPAHTNTLLRSTGGDAVGGLSRYW